MKFLILKVLFLLCFLLSGCWEKSNNILEPSTKKGNISINVIWPESTSINKKAYTVYEVGEIIAYIYSGEKEITFQKLRHEGNRGIAVIELGVGEKYRLELIAKKLYGDQIVYVGSEENITIKPEETTILNITMAVAVPTLSPGIIISNDSFSISWSSVPVIVSYQLEENMTGDFSSSSTAYTGADTTITFTEKAPGVYYYSVFARTEYRENWFWKGNTEMSNIISVEIGSLGNLKIDIPWPGE